ncbi:hypothetical protein [uncultured Desulfovibrio sp.]|uniref:Uncharacterized protein n=1 Tax=Candidatus Desulfovibrio intestinavium TaxID=2838534 RepID=A0A9D2HLI6_9BACT|nr:hypothetical protein [uncultured Desulfovibrio sp.]HJA79130.1 hypothetical protein [Candidatus Desulfovibrio intestinavium]
MLDYRRFKEINDLFAAGQAEQARRLLMELQSRCIALRDEMERLRQQVHALEEILYLSKHLRQENGVYWLTTAGVRQGPFCPYCYDTLGTLIRLEAREFSLSCPACGQGHPLPPPAAAPRMARIIPFAR